MEFRKIFITRDLKTIDKRWAYLSEKEKDFITYFKNQAEPEPKDFNRLQEIAGKYKKWLGY